MKSTKKYYIDVTCKGCNTVFPKIKSDVKRWKSGMCIKCSTKNGLAVMNGRDRTGKNNHNWIEPIKCIDCSKEIKVTSDRKKTQKRCIDCYHKSRHNKSFCKTCGKELLHSHTNYCAKCFPETRQGEKSEAWKGGLPNCTICGNSLSVYKNLTGICQKCSIGDKSHRWNHSITMEDREKNRVRFYNPLHVEWRKKVFERDGYDCQKCGQHGQKLCAHHVESYRKNKEKRYDVSNGVTLCRKCHVDYHNKYGWFDSNRKDLNEFLEQDRIYFIPHSFGYINAAI